MMKWQNVSIAEAEQMLTNREILLLDMRDFRSYLSGHHPRAIHLDEQSLRAILKHTDRAVPILIYCYHGHKSQEMSQLFSDFGFTSCYSLDGGYEAWFPQVRLPMLDLSNTLKRWMLAHGFNPRNMDERSINNETALMQAAREGNEFLSRELVMAGCTLNLINQDGNNALWMASQSGSLAVVKLLLDNDIDMDQQNDHGATALMYAASMANIGLVEMLLKAGANSVLMTRDDISALDAASNSKVLRLIQQYSNSPINRYVA
ncbi:ankyrin repeat domain-containing protein [Thalassolituus sp.]|uniref:ankyrin repeat domain-containing protein n=1 Tax=Thalassolituus sp. TaxID=2030822 RepID=UPI002A833AA2|nr:ankyrin repeat domain-containing protein [Thalassolituus sp.]